MCSLKLAVEAKMQNFPVTFDDIPFYASAIWQQMTGIIAEEYLYQQYF